MKISIYGHNDVGKQSPNTNIECNAMNFTALWVSIITNDGRTKLISKRIAKRFNHNLLVRREKRKLCYSCIEWQLRECQISIQTVFVVGALFFSSICTANSPIIKPYKNVSCSKTFERFSLMFFTAIIHGMWAGIRFYCFR